MNQEYKNHIKNDIEKEDNFQDDNATDFLNKKQRELVTSTIDYNLESLSRLIDNKVIDLAPKYQRRFRWDDARKSKLIESFLMNIPIPPIFLNEDNLGKYSVIDGKQRLSAINDFLNEKYSLLDLEVFKDLNGKKFSGLPIEFQNSLNTRANIRAVIILRQSDKDIKYEVFLRLNTGGVSLNPQEIRNSAFPGKLNDKIIEISENSKFHNLLGIKLKDKSRIYKEMRDSEMVLRFFALKDNWKKYPGNLKRILDGYMDDNKNMPDGEIKKLEKDFFETLEKVESVFGKTGSFRRWIPKNKKWKQQVSVPIFDSQMFACYMANGNSIKNNREMILKKFKALFKDDKEYIDSIGSSTGSPAKFLYRSHKLKEIIEKND